MSDISRIMVYVVGFAQVVVLPLILTYWQSAYLRQKINAAVARFYAWIRLQGITIAAVAVFSLSAVAYAVIGMPFALATATLLTLVVQVALHSRQQFSLWSASIAATEQSADKADRPISWVTVGVKDGSDCVTERPTGSRAMATDNATERPMLYYRLDNRLPAGRHRGSVLAIVDYSNTLQPGRLKFTTRFPFIERQREHQLPRSARLQYDGRFPFMEAARVSTLQSNQHSQDSLKVVYLIDRPRFDRRQQGVADFRINSVGPGQTTRDADDLSVNRIVLVAAPR